MPSRPAASFGAGALLFLSLFFLRHQLIMSLQLDYAHALRVGLPIGMLYDFAMLALPYAASSLVAATLGRGRFAAWAIAAFAIWLPSVSNAAYFQFFESRLDWWIVSTHLKDLFVVRGTAGDILISVGFLLSTTAFLGALAFAWLGIPGRRTRKRPVHALGAIGLVTVFLLLRQSPVWAKVPRFEESILAGQIVNVWWNQWTRPNAKEASYQILPRAIQEKEKKPPAATLAEYRDRATNDGFVYEALENGKDWPLLTRFKPDPETSKELRLRFGLPLDREINFMVLSIESARAFELLHPKLGQTIFPKLRKVLDRHGVVFSQAYASANMTANGQFSTMCSILPNLLGPAVYFNHYKLRVVCGQEFFKQRGYRTVWLNSFRKDFHNKFLFESGHGMELFFDEAYFREKGITQGVGDWGLADRPYLLESLSVLENQVKEGKPFFANMLTISTHTPWYVVPEGPLPEGLLDATATNPEYQGFLSRFRYVDDALGEFFERFFKSPIADNTVVIILGDHGQNLLAPHLPIEMDRRLEIWHRIPLAFVSKGLKEPKRLDYPVHQIDILPTLGLISGKEGEVTWQGRNLFSGNAGSPWVWVADRLVAYRDDKVACYPRRGERRLRCWDVAEKAGDYLDPLFDADVKEIPEDPKRTGFYWKIVHANQQAIRLDLFAPESRLEGR